MARISHQGRGIKPWQVQSLTVQHHNAWCRDSWLCHRGYRAERLPLRRQHQAGRFLPALWNSYISASSCAVSKIVWKIRPSNILTSSAVSARLCARTSDAMAFSIAAMLGYYGQHHRIVWVFGVGILLTQHADFFGTRKLGPEWNQPVFYKLREGIVAAGLYLAFKEGTANEHDVVLMKRAQPKLHPRG